MGCQDPIPHLNYTIGNTWSSPYQQIGREIIYTCKYNESEVTIRCLENRTWSELSGACPPPPGCLERPSWPSRVYTDTFTVGIHVIFLDDDIASFIYRI